MNTSNQNSARGLTPEIEKACFQGVYGEGPFELAKAYRALASDVDAQDAVPGLRQKVWEALRILGYDTDGDATPDALVTDIGDILISYAAGFRKDYDEALKEIPATPHGEVPNPRRRRNEPGN